MNLRSTRGKRAFRGYQPTLEILENRTVPSCVKASVSLVDDDHLAVTPKIALLKITGNSTSQGVEIVDHDRSGGGAKGNVVELNMDCDGDGLFEKPDNGPDLPVSKFPNGIQMFTVRMGGG